MAAPHVSGIAAVLMQKFPSLNASAITARIKRTASVAGLKGKSGETVETHGMQVMRAIFGHGLINQTKASAQIGTLTLATGQKNSSTKALELISPSKGSGCLWDFRPP